MFNIGSSELLLIFIVALIVIGPERLPMAVKTAGLWIGRFRRSFYKVKAEIERELNTDEIRRQLHNESVMADIEDAKSQIKGAAKDTEDSVKNIVNSANFDPGASQETDAQLERQKSIQQELEEAGEHVEGITRQTYGSGKNPKLAQTPASEAEQSAAAAPEPGSASPEPSPATPEPEANTTQGADQAEPDSATPETKNEQ